MIKPNRPKALQTYLLAQSQTIGASRVGFLKVEAGNGPAIVFNEGDRGVDDLVQNFEKGIDIFPILIDVVVKYEDYAKGYDVRANIRKLIGNFNGSLSNDWEGTISFKQFLAPVYNKETNEIVFGGIYLLKQNYDYEVLPTPTVEENANNSN